MLKKFINLLSVLFIAISVSACATTGGAVSSTPVLIKNESPDFSIVMPPSWTQTKTGEDYLTLSKALLMIRIFENTNMTDNTSPKQSAESIVNFLKDEFKIRTFEVTDSNAINIADGTKANEAEIYWIHPKYNVTCYSYGICAKRGETRLSVIAAGPTPIDEKTRKIIKSLKIN